MYEHGNRIYQLQFENGDVGKLDYVRLDLSNNLDEYEVFFDINEDNTVMVNIHNCRDLTKQKLGIDNVYYVWQRRNLNRLPSVCPRCKYRLDAPAIKRRRA